MLAVAALALAAADHLTSSILALTDAIASGNSGTNAEQPAAGAAEGLGLLPAWLLEAVLAFCPATAAEGPSLLPACLLEAALPCCAGMDCSRTEATAAVLDRSTPDLPELCKL